MTFPESVLSIVREEDARNPSDVGLTITRVERRIKDLPEYESLVSALVRQAVQTLVYSARHTACVRARRESGGYGQPAKVPQTSSAFNRIQESLYDYRIAGTTLGQVYGRELRALADNEQAMSNGHLFNYRLLLKLAALVPADKRVIEVVKEKKLQAIFREERERVVA